MLVLVVILLLLQVVEVVARARTRRAALRLAPVVEGGDQLGRGDLDRAAQNHPGRPHTQVEREDCVCSVASNELVA